MRRNEKTAFTLAEIILSFIVIGIISVLSFQTLRTVHNKYNTAYYSAYEILKQSAGNAALRWVDESTHISGVNKDTTTWDDYQKTDAVEKTNVREIYPGFLLGSFTSSTSGDSTSFCARLKEFVNTTDEYKCNSILSTISSSDSDGSSFIDMFGVGGKMPAPSFSTTNGLDFYITKMTGSVGTNDTNVQAAKSDGTMVNSKVYFRFVAVDLNGNRRPNDHIKKGSTLPDIVWFAITSNGAVVPIGRPEVDIHYARANVIYPEYLDRDICDNSTGSNGADGKPDYNLTNNANCKLDTDNPAIRKSKPMTIYEAGIMAWGKNTTVPSQGFSGYEPLSFTRYFMETKSKTGAAPSAKVVATEEFYVQLLEQIYKKEYNNSTDTLYSEVATLTPLDTQHGCSANVSRCKVTTMR